MEMVSFISSTFQQTTEIAKSLERLPSDIKKRLLQGGKSAFANMTKETMSKLHPSVFAAVGQDAIRSMDQDQLKGMVKRFGRGTNSKDLEKILKEVDSTQFKNILGFLKNSTDMFSKKQMEAFAKRMKQNKGDPSTWSAGTVKELGGLIKGLSPKELKNLASAGRATFEASLEELSKINVKSMTKGQRREIVRGASKSFGSQSTWNSSTLTKMAKFVGDMNHKDIAKIPVAAIKGAISSLAEAAFEGKSFRELMKKVKDPKNGFGRSNQWTAGTLRSLGNLTAGMTVKDINDLDRHAIKGALDTLGKSKLSRKQARKMASKVKEAFGSPDTWTVQIIRNASNILRGLKPKDLRKLPAQAIRDSLESLKHIHFSRSQKRELAKKVKESLGDPSKWNESVVQFMGPLIGGLSLSDLKSIPNNAIKSALNSLKDDDTVPPAKRRAILRKAKEAGKVRLLDVGSFLDTYSLEDLEDVDPIADLGNDTEDGNNTQDDTHDRKKLPWKLSQARKMLHKVKKVWGDPASNESQWTLQNIDRLQGLAIGIWKSLLDSMPAHDIADIVEELSQQQGFTSGQVHVIDQHYNVDDVIVVIMKMIIRAYKDKLGLNLPSRFSDLDQIEIEALGSFIVELDEIDLENLSPDAGIEAVRQIGVTPLNHKPRGLVRRKLTTALRLLAKKRGETDLAPEDLTSEDLYDLGNLALGFTPEELKRIEETSFKDAIHTLGKIEGFDKEQLQVLADKAKEAYKGSGIAEDAPSQLTDEDVYDLGNILSGFTKEDFAKMDEHVVKDNIDYLGSLSLDQQQAEGLMAQATAAKRKRRDTDLSGKTGDELIAMGNTLLALHTADIGTISNAAFDEAASAIGAIKHFSGIQLEAWASKAQQAWNESVELITSEQLLRLGVMSVGFSAQDLGRMALDSDDVIESLGSQQISFDVGVEAGVGYSKAQVSSAWTNIKTRKGKTINEFTGDEIAALKNFALAMTPLEITSIHYKQFGVAINTLGGLKGWSVDQMVKLKEKCFEHYGPLVTWTGAESREAGVAIGGFTPAELTYITGDLLSMVTPTAIASMPISLFKTFSTEQLKHFDSSQAAAVTTAQKDALSLEKLAILQETAGVTQNSGTGKYTIYYSIHLTARRGV
ncbi:hypothetical protein QZH41_014715 [Actinostola sp. cb2023]|nr:hypothetical protein QZH41_014715 [Actinostola sp. cb2023]